MQTARPIVNSRSIIAGVIGLFLATSLAIATTAPSSPESAVYWDGDSLLGLDVWDEPAPYFDMDRRVLREPGDLEHAGALSVVLPRYRVWAEDGHLDVIVQSGLDAAELLRMRMEVEVVGSDGAGLHRVSIFNPAPQMIFFPAIPDELSPAGEGLLRVRLYDGDKQIAEVNEPFRVESGPGVASSGAIPIRIANSAAAVVDGMPITVGVPFPRGALSTTDNLRLVALDGDGDREIPVQVDTVARWSRHGSIQWVHCHFVIDLAGQPQELELRYGSDVRRMEREPMAVGGGKDGLPTVDAGLLRLDGGLWYDVSAAGDWVEVMRAAGFSGGFIEHEDGRVYRMDSDAGWKIESLGPERLMIARRGWYREPESGAGFCQYIARFVIFRDSPVVRLFFTWIFTGDGNRDRIRNMGWSFDLPEGFVGDGFQADASNDPLWLDGTSLLQWDFEHFDVMAPAGIVEVDGGRAPGVAAVKGRGVRTFLGVRDFWQNYPSELEFGDGALLFHNWPRHNRPAGHTFDKQLITARGAPAQSASAARYAHEDADQLTDSEWRLNAVQARYAHEGQVLSFRLPDAFATDPIYSAANDSREGGSPEWQSGDVESINAQGVSRSEEVWLYFTPERSPLDRAVPFLNGLNAETVRAVVSPQWIADSGAMLEIHPQDWQQFPEEERIYEMVALSPAKANEHLGIYGMWIYGDIPAWGLNLERRAPELYRSLRKRHLGWPYPWLPFARSGDPRFFKLADAATRKTIDSGYCHFVGDDIEALLGPEMGSRRKIGLWDRGLVPWAARGDTSVRGYENRVDFLLDSWFLTGYPRAKDMLETIGPMFKNKDGGYPREMSQFGRSTQAQLKTCVQLYEYSGDPWFGVAAQAYGRGHANGASREHPSRTYGGRHWDTGDREYNRFSGDPQFADFYLNRHLQRLVSESERTDFNTRHPVYPAKADGWRLTGDEYFLRRTVDAIDSFVAWVRDADDPPYMQGTIHGTSSNRYYTFFTPYTLRWLPHALWAVADAGYRPAPIPSLRNAYFPTDGPVRIAYRKEQNQPLSIALRVRTGVHPTARAAAGAPPYTFLLENSAGEPVASGEWPGQDDLTLEVEAEEPDDTYFLTLNYPRRPAPLAVPTTSYDTKEVVLIPPGQPLPNDGYLAVLAWWFHVPHDVDSFTVHFARHGSASVWNPAGERVWSHSKDGTGQPMTARITVPAEFAGQLWRITQPPAGTTLDPAIPPLISLSPSSWFVPKSD